MHVQAARMLAPRWRGCGRRRRTGMLAEPAVEIALAAGDYRGGAALGGDVGQPAALAGADRYGRSGGARHASPRD